MIKMIKRTTLTAVAVAVAGVLSFSNVASAGGFIADTFVKPFSPELAERLDDAHERMERPLDKIAPHIADSVAPGTGRLLDWQMERNRQESRNRRHARDWRSSGRELYGNRCMTRYGVSAPGPRNRLGSRCWVDGNIPGRVVR
jgi:hypothetical protein